MGIVHLLSFKIVSSMNAPLASHDIWEVFYTAGVSVAKTAVIY